MSTSLLNGLGGTSGFGENFLARNDDSFTGFIDLSSIFGAAGINFFGTSYNGLYLNNNGSVSFGSGIGAYTPTVITGSTSNPIIAAYWGDVDTRPLSSPVSPGGTSTGSNLLWYDLDTTNRRFTATWDDVGFYNQFTTKTNSFQITLQQVGLDGDFDIIFRYEDINWTTGTASGGSNEGLGGTIARAGYSSGNGVNWFELPQSGNQAAMLALESASNIGTAGTYVFNVRGGQARSDVSVGDVAIAEGNGGIPNFAIVPVYLAAPSGVTVTVRYATVAGTATSGQDFVSQGGLLTFAPGVTQQNIFIEINGDTVIEPDETFVVNLSNATGAAIADSQGTVTIINDDGISIANASLLEGTGTAPTSMVFTITLLTPSTGPVSVNWATRALSATAGTDFTAANGVVTFAPGETAKTVTVQVTADSTPEPHETFEVVLSAPTGALLARTAATGTILNDDGFVINDLTIIEGTASTPQNASVTIRLLSAATVATSVNWTTAPDNASSPGDFTASSGTVNFAIGETVKTVLVPIVRDSLTEANETFRVVLSGPTGTTIVDDTATVTILDDDGFSVSDASITEGASGTRNLAFTVSLGSALATASTVQFATANGSATAGSDYVAASGTLNFAAGATTQTVNVTVNGDLTPEATEALTLTLSNATGGVGIIRATGTGTIVNDDGVSVSDSTVTEGNSGSRVILVNVSLSAAATAPVSINFATEDGTALAGSDYVATNGTLNFAAGQTSKTISVTINGDTIFEGNETFRVLLSSPVGTGIVDGSATVTITNDDTRPPPSFRVIDAAMVEGTGPGNSIMRFQVALSEVSTSALSVSYATSPGSSSTGTDFVTTSGTLTIPAGSLFGFVEVPVIRDGTIEANETLTLTLSNPSAGSAIAVATATGTILNDDVSFRIVPVSSDLAEGTGGAPNSFTFDVFRDGVSEFEHDVSWAVTGAVNGADFQGGSLPTGLLNFTLGETQDRITLTAVPDSDIEPDEAFTVTLSNATNGSVIGTTSANGVIRNDDTSYAIAAANADRNEGNSGTTPYTFTISRHGLLNAATVNWTVDTALSQTNGADFAGGSSPSGSFAFAEGNNSATVSVNVAGDNDVEGDETFFVRITPPAGSTANFSTASGVIRNDDSTVAGAVSIADARLTEGNSGTSQMAFTVTRSGGTAAFSLNYITGPDTASTGDNDYVATSGLLSFAAGENSKTIFVTINGDTRVEASETFFLQLANPSAGATFADSQAVGTIVNDDAGGPPVATPASFVTYLTRSNASPLLSSLVSATDPDGNAISVWQFWDNTPGSGAILKPGSGEQAALTLIELTASEFGNARFDASTGYDNIYARAFDGTEWSGWTNFWVVAPVNHTPVVTAPNAFLARANANPSLSSLINVMDADGDAVQRWQFWDATAGNGNIRMGGVDQPSQSLIEMTASQFSAATFRSTTGWDQVWVRADDGYDWGEWTSFYVVAPINQKPVVAGVEFINMLPRSNPNPLLSSLVVSNDRDGDVIQRWQIVDLTAGNGAIVQGATRMGEMSFIEMTSAEFATARYQSGGGYDQLYVRAHDGIEWGDFGMFWMVAPPNALPVVTPANTTFNGAGVSRALTSLVNVSDADGDTAKSWELWDQTPGGGNFRINGVAQAAQAVISVSQAQIAQTTFQSGATDDDVWVRAWDGYEWSAWTYLKMDNLLA